MRSAILNVTFDCVDSALMARFWSEVTRWPTPKATNSASNPTTDERLIR